MDQPVLLREGAHAGEPRDARTMRQAHQHGLGLVVERMGCDEERRAALAHPRAQQGVARGPRPLLDARRGLAPFPAQHGVREAAIARPGADFLGFVARILPQPVIHGRDLERGRRLGFGNERGKLHQGDRIGPAGDGEQGALG